MERELEAVNRFAKTVLTEEQVYIFSVRLCDNEVDRDLERFAVSSQLLKSPTTDTFCAWGAQTRKIHPRLFLLSAGCAPSQCHPSVRVPA